MIKKKIKYIYTKSLTIIIITLFFVKYLSVFVPTFKLLHFVVNV